MWDPGQYRRFAGERSRPFFELLARVGATAPGFVADLGCGPGDLTAALAGRWPGADVVGVDSSAEMIRSAQAMLSAGGPASRCSRLRFVQADLRAWRPGKLAGHARERRVAGLPGARQFRPAESPDPQGSGGLAALAAAAP